MTNEQDRPLWEAVEDACAGNPDNLGVPDMAPSDWGIAFRAIADVVAPEEPEPFCSSVCRNHSDELRWERWQQRMATRAKLLAEAERAEKGDDVQRHLDDFQNRHAADFQALAGE
jgi:hypothetical protein